MKQAVRGKRYLVVLLFAVVGIDTINFNIASAGVKAINLRSALPTIRSPLPIFGSVICGVAEAQRRDTASNLRPQHKEVVEQWLASSARRANLRVAMEKDCLNKSGLAATRKERGRNYHPYYAVGDFNRDGREDFAVAFVNDRKRQQKFSFAIFNGPFGKSSVPAYIDEAVDISQMGFFYGGRGSDLLLGEFESDYCVIFKPRGKTYKGQPCLDD